MSADESGTIKNSLEVPSSNSCLELGGGGYPTQNSSFSNGSNRSRRCSARILSATLRETLRQLRKKEHKRRVQRLKREHTRYYSRQRCCECATMLSLITAFTLFAFYVILSYGFYFGFPRPFELSENLTTRIVTEEGNPVELICQTDRPWEWCRWIHYDRLCDFERVTESTIERRNCDLPDSKISFFGNYTKHQCGLKLRYAEVTDRGLWQCEMEKYYLGFSRKYGELKTFGIMLVVLRDPSSPIYTSPSTPSTSSVSPAPFSVNNATEIHEESTEEEDYQRSFFFLKMFILGGMGFVLGTLALMFWFYFMYLWRTWDSHGNCKNRDSFVEASFQDGIAEEHDENPSSSNNEDPLQEDSLLRDEFSRSLYESRRKSVSFAVVRMSDRNTMSFEKKTVRLSGSNVSGSASSQRIPSITTTTPNDDWEEVVFDEFDDGPSVEDQKVQNETTM